MAKTESQESVAKKRDKAKKAGAGSIQRYTQDLIHYRNTRPELRQESDGTVKPK